jgi:hypothetical protein
MPMVLSGWLARRDVIAEFDGRADHLYRLRAFPDTVHLDISPPKNPPENALGHVDTFDFIQTHLKGLALDKPFLVNHAERGHVGFRNPTLKPCFDYQKYTGEP